MTHRMSITTNDAGEMIERTYDYEVTFPDKTPMEQVEAHLKNMLQVLDEQAHEGSDDDEDAEKWKKG